MAILVRIPTPLRKFTHGRAAVEADGLTISDVLQNLGATYPGILERLYDGEGLKRFINLYLNNEDIRFLEGEETPVRGGDQLSIIPAIAGGMGRT